MPQIRLYILRSSLRISTVKMVNIMRIRLGFDMISEHLFEVFRFAPVCTFEGFMISVAGIRTGSSIRGKVHTVYYCYLRDS